MNHYRYFFQLELHLARENETIPGYFMRDSVIGIVTWIHELLAGVYHFETAPNNNLR